MHFTYGMVGGGKGALIGKAHRTSIALNGDCRLTAGAFSASSEKNLASGRDLGVDDERIYVSYDEMAQKEAAREDGINFVVIVTPNHLHYSAARTFLEQLFLSKFKKVFGPLTPLRYFFEYLDKKDDTIIRRQPPEIQKVLNKMIREIEEDR